MIFSYCSKKNTGWNSWNHFHCGINETILRQTADAMVALGLAGAGYEYGRLIEIISRLFNFDYINQ